MSQSKQRSFVEAWINIFVGYSINFAVNLIVFPAFGYHITVRDNIFIGIIFTFVSLARSYGIRRWMAKGD